MASARIEFITLNSGVGETKFYGNTIRDIHAVADIEVTSTVTAAGSRPAAPTAFGSYTAGHARITAIGGSLIVVIGDNPTATATAPGLRVQSGATEVLSVKAGQKLSFLAVAG